MQQLPRSKKNTVYQYWKWVPLRDRAYHVLIRFMPGQPKKNTIARRKYLVVLANMFSTRQGKEHHCCIWKTCLRRTLSVSASVSLFSFRRPRAFGHGQLSTSWPQFSRLRPHLTLFCSHPRTGLRQTAFICQGVSMSILFAGWSRSVPADVARSERTKCAKSFK